MGISTFTGSQNVINNSVDSHILKQAIQTGSQDLVNYNISVVTSSIDSHILKQATQTGSQDLVNLGISTFTGSLRSEVNLIEAYTASLKGAAIVSSSQQITNYYKFAETASANTFYGTQTITGSVNVTGSITIASGSITMPNRPAFRIVGTGGEVLAPYVLSGSKVSVDYNQGNHFNTTNGLFTAPIAGLYQVNLVIRTNSNTNSTINQAIVYKQSSAIDTAQIMIEFAANTTMNHSGGSTITKLEAGDTLRAQVVVGTCSFDGNNNFSVAYIG